MNSEHRTDPARTLLHNVRISEESASAIAKESPLGTIAIDAEGIIKFWNKASEQITGWREDEVLGRSIKVLAEECYTGSSPGSCYRRWRYRCATGIKIKVLQRGRCPRQVRENKEGRNRETRAPVGWGSTE